MTHEEAYRLLANSGLTIFSEEELYSCGWYLSANADEETATLDGAFSAYDLEAIAMWMNNPKAVMGAKPGVVEDE